MSELPVTIYTPESSLANPAQMLRSMIGDLAAGRELAWRLAVRDIRAQYRQTVLGILWAFILPLANTLTWIFLSHAGIVTVSGTSLPYPLYVFTGTMLWAIFMDALNSPLQQVNASRGMLGKLNFPREAIIVSGLYQTLFNASIKIALLLGVLASFSISSKCPGWQQLFVGIFPECWGWPQLINVLNPGLDFLLFPLGIASLILVGTALGLLITPVGMLYGDIGRALPLLMQFLMYITPVVFPLPKEGWPSTLVSLNPLTPIILTARDWLTGTSPEFLDYFLWVNAVAVVLLLLVWVVYRLAMPIMIERMSA